MTGHRVALRGRVVGPDRVHDDGVVAIDRDRIGWVGPAREWLTRPESADWPSAEPVPLILPGLVDVHCHGAAGGGFPDGDPASALTATRHHQAHGTTAMLASLVTAPEPDLLRAAAVCADLVETGEVVGLHLEGPFLSAHRCGAQDPRSLLAPDTALLERLVAAARGHVRTMTYAPELPGADDLADRARQLGVVLSVGHTDADAGTVTRALGHGARDGNRTSVTHLFNGMAPMHHRAPGPVAASLAAAARGETVLELIADGVHLADETVAMVFDLVGPTQVALVTDAMAAAGVADGAYRLGRLDVEVSGGVARLAGEGPSGSRSIAGGTSRLVEVVRRVVRHAGVDLLSAVTAASATPAALLGLGGVTGALAAGLRADVLVTDEALVPQRVMRAGRWLDGTTR